MTEEEEYSQAKKHAVRRLTLQSQSKSKLKKALLKKEITEEVADKVIEEFATAGYLNDEEYAIRLIQREMDKYRGPRWIKQKLYVHGISSKMADKLLDEHYPHKLQVEKAKALLEKKKCEPRKQFGLLMRNGFSPDAF